MADPIIIDYLGGNCPVQAEGTICGEEFYFRARGDRWALNVGGEDVIMAPTWRHEEPFGTWPDAGWMDFEQAELFLRQAAANYIKQYHPDRVVDLKVLPCEPEGEGPVEPSLPGPTA